LLPTADIWFQERKDALETLIGASEFAERQTGWQPKLTAIGDGLCTVSFSSQHQTGYKLKAVML